jgi:hypothetical protein
MIRLSEGSPWADELSAAPAGAPSWAAPRPDRLAFATLLSTGDDPRRDALVRVLALRQGPEGFASYASHCALRPGGAEPEAVSARLAREHGVRASDLAGAPDAETVLGELHAFLAGRTVIVPARAA